MFHRQIKPKLALGGLILADCLLEYKNIAVVNPLF